MSIAPGRAVGDPGGDTERGDAGTAVATPNSWRTASAAAPGDPETVAAAGEDIMVCERENESQIG